MRVADFGVAALAVVFAGAAAGFAATGRTAGFAASFFAGAFTPARPAAATPFAATLVFAGALAADRVAALAVTLAVALAGAALVAGFAAARGAAFADEVFAADGFFAEADATARAPARDSRLVESFEDTLDVTFLDAGCLTDFATFASLSEVRIRQPTLGHGPTGQRNEVKDRVRRDPARQPRFERTHWGTVQYIKTACAWP